MLWVYSQKLRTEPMENICVQKCKYWIMALWKEKAVICNICQFLWCKYSCHGYQHDVTRWQVEKKCAQLAQVSYFRYLQHTSVCVCVCVCVSVCVCVYACTCVSEGFLGERTPDLSLKWWVGSNQAKKGRKDIPGRGTERTKEGSPKCNDV